MRIAWGAVAAVARADLRLRRRAVLIGATMLGIGAAAGFGALAVAERTATAYGRLLDATEFEDLSVVGLDAGAVAEVRALPGVAGVRSSPAFVGQLDGPGQVYLSMGAVPAPGESIGRPLVLEGQGLHLGSTDEVLVGEPIAEQLGLHAGDTIGFTLLTPQEYLQFGVGFGEPDGAALRLRVVGIARYPLWGQNVASMQVSPALAQSVAADAVAATTLVRFGPGVDRQAMAERIGAIAERVPVADPYLTPTVLLQSADPAPAVAVGRTVTVTALAGFAAVAAFGALLISWQSVTRQLGASHSDQSVESALGLRLLERTAARALLYLPAALLSALIAGCGVIAAGLLAPAGALRQYEPDPGWRVETSIALWASVLTSLVLPAAAAVFCLTLRRPGAADGSRRPSGVGRLARGPIGLVACTSLGAARGRAHRSPGRDIAVLAAVIGAITAIGIVQASAARAEATREMWGWRADFAVEDVKPDQIALLETDPRVAAIQPLRGGSVVLDRPEGTAWTVSAFGAGRPAGRSPLPLVSGRLPSADHEVALGPAVAHTLELDVGGEVQVRGLDGSALALRVVGIVLVPPLYNGSLGESLITTPALIESLNPGTATSTALVQATVGTGPQLREQWRRRAELIEPYRPPAVAALAELGALPWLVDALLAVVAGAALARASGGASPDRRRRLDVLRAIGMTPRQVALAEVASVGALAACAALVGVPLGLAAGRLAWTEIAGDLGLPVRLAGAAESSALVLAGLLTLALAAALPAALEALRRRGAGELRAE